MAIRGHDSRFLSDSRMGKDLAKKKKFSSTATTILKPILKLCNRRDYCFD